MPTSPFPYLERNLKTLAEMRHPVGQWLADAKVNLKLLASRLFTNPHGTMDFRMTNGSLFQGTAPGSHYRQWMQKVDDRSVTIIVGSSLGYGVNLCLAQSPRFHKVLVLEPDPDMLTAMLGLSDYSEQLMAGRLHILLPEIDYLDIAISKLSLQHMFGKIHFRLDTASKPHDETYVRWGQLLRDKLERFSAEQNTIHTMQDVMIENELRNFKRALSQGSLSQLQGSAANITALVFGAGPSLQQTGPQLMAQPHNSVIFSALQTLPALHKLGINTDICVAIDYTPSMLELLPNLDMERAARTLLIYSTKVHPDLLAAYPGPKLPLWAQGGIGTKTMRGKEPVIDVGSNVSITCRRLLAWMGCKRVIYAGMDLAWLDGKTHSPGHHYASPVSSMAKDIIRTTTGAGGKTLMTSVQYHVAQMELEEDAGKDGPETINIYGGGAFIKGIPNISSAEAFGQQLLDTTAEARSHFLETMRKATECSRNFKYTPQEPRWQKTIAKQRIKLQLTFSDLSNSHSEALAAIRDLTRLLGHSAMFAPYFHKEIHELAEYTHARANLKAADLPEIEKIMDAVLKKIQFADAAFKN